MCYLFVFTLFFLLAFYPLAYLHLPQLFLSYPRLWGHKWTCTFLQKDQKYTVSRIRHWQENVPSLLPCLSSSLLQTFSWDEAQLWSGTSLNSWTAAWSYIASPLNPQWTVILTKISSAWSNCKLRFAARAVRLALLIYYSWAFGSQRNIIFIRLMVWANVVRWDPKNKTFSRSLQKVCFYY